MKTCLKTIFLLAITSFAQMAAQTTSHLITFFMRPYPYVYMEEKEVTQEYADRKSKKLRRPDKIAKYTLRSILETSTASGIFSTYHGQLAVSDFEGQVSFARMQADPDLHLLITPRIDPFLKKQQVIDHWEIERGVPAQLYSVSLVEDEDTEISYWNVERIDPIPNKRIDLNTIIVFAKPSHILVPEGISIVKRSPNLVLPDLYVKKNVDKLSTSLYVLNLKRFFQQTQKQKELEAKDSKIIRQLLYSDH